MSVKAEYWGLTLEEFNEHKSRMSLMADKTLKLLMPYRFTRIESQNEWLGYLVKRTENNIMTFVSFSLHTETPRNYEHILRQWNNKNPSETSIDFYKREFNSLHEFEAAFDDEMEIIIVKLKTLN